MSKSISPGEQAAFSEGSFTIDGRMDLAGARASMTVTIKREPNTTGIEKKRRLSNETLLAIAAAYPLEQGERIHISGLRRRYWMSEGAKILWSGDRAREITVFRASSCTEYRKYRELHLCCDIGVVSPSWILDEATDDFWVRALCEHLREEKQKAAAGPTIDENGRIRIPMGMARADGTFFEYPVELIYRPRLCVWTERNYWRFNIGGMMHTYPEVAHMVRGFFDRLSPRRKARALAMAMAA